MTTFRALDSEVLIDRELIKLSSSVSILSELILRDKNVRAVIGLLV